MSRDDPVPADRVVLATVALVLGTVCLLAVAFAPGLVPDRSASSDAAVDDTPIVADRDDAGTVDGNEAADTESTAADRESSPDVTDSATADETVGTGPEASDSVPEGGGDRIDRSDGSPGHADEDGPSDRAGEPGPPDHAGPPSDGDRGPPDHAGPD